MGNMPSSFNIRQMNFVLEERQRIHRQQIEAARKAEEEKRLMHARSLQLSDLLPGETEWEAFWATVDDGATCAQIIAAIEAELDRLAQPK